MRRFLTAGLATPLALVALGLGCVGLVAPPAHAELVEEIIAWVNGDIITKSDLELAEQVRLSGAYQNYTGTELDKAVEQLREQVLIELIDAKILTQRAHTLFNLERMRESLWERFKQEQGIDDDAELRKLLEEQGLSEDSFKDMLIERNAPDEVLNYEVGARVVASDGEVREYFKNNPDQFHVPGEVTLREIVVLADTQEQRNKRRAEASKILEEARLTKEDADYSALVKRVSEAGTGPSGGLLGPLQRDDLNEQLGTVAFSLEVGEVSGLLETPYGFHIIKVVERNDDRQLTLSEIRDQLEGHLDNQKFVEARQAYLEKIRTEAEWCVKENYRDRLPIPSQECRQL